MIDRDAPFDLTLSHADAINALLPTCKYVVGIRENATGEVRFCPQKLPWTEQEDYSDTMYWRHGNMGCDCNRELEFRRQTEDCDIDDVQCSDGRFTVVGIWFPDGSSIRDLNAMNDF